MEKEFATYEIALKLKELCFDEECFAIYDAYQHNRLVYLNEDGRNSAGIIKTNESMEISSLAPLWQQAIDWFREKHNIYIYIKPVFDNLGKSEMYQWEMKIRNRVFIKNGDYKDFYEAREQAILKAIEIIKQKTNENF